VSTADVTSSQIGFRPTSSQIGLAAVGAVGLAMLFVLPMVLDLFSLLQLTVYVIFAILALSLGFVLGYGGILCLGQAAFFGIGAYTYAIAGFNIEGTTLPFLLGLAAPAIFAAAVGYFIFYGRITDVYVGVITITVTLILFSLVNSTAGPEYKVGNVLLGGFNGIPNLPLLEWPFQPGNWLSPEDTFRFSLICLLASYFGLRWLLASRFGRVVVSVRENERRAELLGYDVRLIKLITFVIGATLAGLAGVLHANWGSFVGPGVFGVIQSAQVLIWVMVGGTGTLLGPVFGCVLLMWFTNALGGQQLINASLMLGATLLVFVLALPAGLLPTIVRLAGMVQRLVAGLMRRRSGAAPARKGLS
jgi:ABC-type branched-subunit amino acid transport system permease subunit